MKLERQLRSEKGSLSYLMILLLRRPTGLSKLEEYGGYMKENDTFWITSILDPRVRTISNEANKIITRIQKYLKDSYPTQNKQTQETYRNLGRWTEAEMLQVQVMQTRKTVPGPEHPHT